MFRKTLRPFECQKPIEKHHRQNSSTHDNFSTSNKQTNMMPSSSNKLVFNSMLIGTCAVVLCLAISVAQAQYNSFDSDSSSDSDNGPILSNSELGKLVRNSAKHNNNNHHHHQNLHGNGQHHQATATRNLYNRQQPLQYAPTQNNRRQYGGAGGDLSGYGPVMGAASHGRGASANNDDDDESGSSNFGPNFDSNDNDGESGNSNADGPTMNLNQAASGYPGQGDYNENAGAGARFGFGGAGGYGEGAEFGPSGDVGFGGGEGRRAKSASSLSGARGYGLDDDAGAPQFGPNSAVNSGDNDDEGRAGYAPEASGDNENDDE